MMNIKAHGSEENYGIDKISSLPDDVRTHILSFLTTKEAVQTCILSKRWINTWASVPDLKFDIIEFGLPKFGDDEMAVECVTKFELLLRSVLNKRETSCVNKFELLFVSNCYLPWTRAFADCIGDVMKLNPRECLVNVGPSKNLKFANLIFTCTSLIHLQLWFSTIIDLELHSVNLACLKTLNLDGVATSDNFLKKLLLGCPVLEELVLEMSVFTIIQICSNTLKKLVLRSYCYGMRIQISTPNLLYLDIQVGMWDILLLNLPSLVDASIIFPGWHEYVTRGPKLIQSLSNVESLRLVFDYPKRMAQKKDFSNCPVFDNLKILELLYDGGLSVFDLAPFFIHQSPKLQEVIIENDDDDVISLSESDIDFVDEEITQEGPRDALVQREFLKTVRIVGFKNKNEFVDKLINKLLLHVKIIGEIDIV